MALFLPSLEHLELKIRESDKDVEQKVAVHIERLGELQDFQASWVLRGWMRL